LPKWFRINTSRAGISVGVDSKGAYVAPKNCSIFSSVCGGWGERWTEIVE